MRALRLISPKIAEGYARCVTHNKNPDLWPTWLQLRWGVPSKDGLKKAEDLIKNVKYETPSWAVGEELIPGKPILARSCVHRAAFLDELVKLIPEGMCSFSKTLEGLSDDPLSDSVTLSFADGSKAEANIVIGCDGVRSRTRALLFGAEESAPKFTGAYGYRSLVPMDHAVEVLGPELAQNGQLHCGYGCYIITYPVEHGDLMNLVAVKQTTEPWPPGKAWIAPATREEMLRDFEGWSEKWLTMLETVKTPEKWALFDAVELTSFWKGRVCLMGDSAHASSPHMGAGSGMGFEDAYVLSNLLGHYFEAVKNGNSVKLQTVFRAFDSVRRERSQKLVTLSRRNGILMQFEDEDVGDDEERVGNIVQERDEWVWSYNLEDGLVKAKQLLGALPTVSAQL